MRFTCTTTRSPVTQVAPGPLLAAVTLHSCITAAAVCAPAATMHLSSNLIRLLQHCLLLRHQPQSPQPPLRAQCCSRDTAQAGAHTCQYLHRVVFHDQHTPRGPHPHSAGAAACAVRATDSCTCQLSYGAHVDIKTVPGLAHPLSVQPPLDRASAMVLCRATYA